MQARVRSMVGIAGRGAVVTAAIGALVLIGPGPAGAAGTGTVAAHVYVCQQYSHNGVPDLQTSTSEATGGTISVPGAGITAQANPLPATHVSAGTYSVTATVPPGFYFTECPGQAATPTLANGAQSASLSVKVSTGGSATASFYVVPFSSATCSAVVGGIQCQLPNTLGLPFFPLSTLVTEASGVSSSVSASTPLVITAFGGKGGAGASAPAASPHGGAGGQAGEAQTALASVTSYQSTYKTPLLFYYLGYQGIGNGQHGDKVGGLGGSSTIVSPENFATSATTGPCISGYSSCTTTNVLALAGGGGGGGQGGDSSSGGHGGNGGQAIATAGGPATAPGAGGSGAGGGGGHAGHGGGTGTAGDGGKSGNGATGKHGGSGMAGIGGTGGNVHTGHGGGSARIPWANAGYLVGVGTAGAGGEGQWRGTGVADGGGGGG
ncbi:MAG: hypothetical protein ACRDZR_12685, partial [Acidimicrobiales bacterium]